MKDKKDKINSRISLLGFFKSKIIPPKQYCCKCGVFIDNFWIDNEDVICKSCKLKLKKQKAIKYIGHFIIWGALFIVSCIYLIQNDNTYSIITLGGYNKIDQKRNKDTQNETEIKPKQNSANEYNNNLGNSAFNKMNNGSYTFSESQFKHLELKNDDIKKRLNDINKLLEEGMLLGNEKKELMKLLNQAKQISDEIEAETILDKD